MRPNSIAPSRQALAGLPALDGCVVPASQLPSTSIGRPGRARARGGSSRAGGRRGPSARLDRPVTGNQPSRGTRPCRRPRRAAGSSRPPAARASRSPCRCAGSRRRRRSTRECRRPRRARRDPAGRSSPLVAFDAAAAAPRLLSPPPAATRTPEPSTAATTPSAARRRAWRTGGGSALLGDLRQQLGGGHRTSAITATTLPRAALGSSLARLLRGLHVRVVLVEPSPPPADRRRW